MNLGLLPGAGGTQRLPRLVGVPKALDMMTSGRHISPSEALAGDLVDEVVEGGPDELRRPGSRSQRAPVAANMPLAKVRDRNDKVEAFRGDEQVFADFRAKIARSSRGFLAPEYNIQCIEAATNLPFDDGLAVERRLFVELVTGAQSAAQRYYFFAERAANKVPDVPKDTPTVDVGRCGVLGAGTMGGGIAMNFANVGIPVTVVERDRDALERGLAVVRKNYERSRSMTPELVKQRMALITGSTDKADFAECDMVIEAVFEDMDLKKTIFSELDQICKPGAIMASNTSALDINEIASATNRPESVIGMHFFSPANVMKLLENVRGDDVVADDDRDRDGDRQEDRKGRGARRCVPRVRRQPHLVPASHRGRPNRPRRCHAGPGRSGPVRLRAADGTVRDERPRRSRHRLEGRDLDQFDSARPDVRVGSAGPEERTGYYTYDPETRSSTPDLEVVELIRGFAETNGIEQRDVTDQEVLERCLYPMVNEGAKILEEGIAIRGSDIDVVWVNGYGWPMYRGGPMYWADSVGLAEVVDRIGHYADSIGGRHWELSPLLAKLAAEGGKLHQYSN